MINPSFIPNIPIFAIAPHPVAIVDSAFSTPSPLQLTLKRDPFSLSGGDFTVFDDSGNVLLRVEGQAFNLRNKRVFLNAAGNPLLSAQRRLLHCHNRWDVFRGDKPERRNCLFSVRRSGFLQIKTSLSVFLASSTDKRKPDFVLKGDYFERSCTLYHGSQAIAQIKRHFTLSNVMLGSDTFICVVYPGIDYAFVATLIVIMDEIHREQGKTPASRTH